MKRSLQVKVWILLGYVMLCTALVLLEQAEMAPPPHPARGAALPGPQ
ncbi:hypothetical protein [Massilia sp. DWR3-1-1]